MLITKSIHIIFAILSISGFFIRGIWMQQESSLLQAKLTRVLPHVIDSVLLVSAIVLAYQYSLNPLTTPWLMAKIIALLLYIGVGTVAIKRGKNKQQRLIAWIGALFIYAYIVMVAVSKSPWAGIGV